MLVIQVPEGKSLTNRLHLDPQTVAGNREAELGRLLELGATELADLRRPDGSGLVVLADPEGNEFCILRNDEERAMPGIP